MDGTDAFVALGAFVSGIFGVKGIDRFRRRNGPTDGDKIVAALKAEGEATRKLQHSCHDEVKTLLGDIRSDTRLLLDRFNRGRAG